jgi:ArsR family transcriptional regulator
VAPSGGDEERLDQISRWAHALSDPIRLRMLDLMLKAQGCCRPGGEDGTHTPAGVCVCELQSLQGLAQSKVSYHLRVLREAGLISEQRRGRWSFYSVDGGAAEDAADAIRRQLGR